MRRKCLMLAASLLMLASGLLMVSPKSAEAIPCPIPCVQDHKACRDACGADTDCWAACYETYQQCCLL